jgi:hypothetical protein
VQVVLEILLEVHADPLVAILFFQLERQQVAAAAVAGMALYLEITAVLAAVLLWVQLI